MISRILKITGIVIAIPVLTIASCGYMLFGPDYHKSGNFVYKCQGGGVFDGSTCLAKIKGAYHLRLMEGRHDKPHITFLVNGGGERVIPPGPGNGRRFIVAVGANDDWFVAKDDLGEYYIVERTESYPVVNSAVSLKDFEKFFENRQKPELHPTLDRFK